MKYILLLLVLCACSKEYTDKTDNYLMPPELGSCKVYRLSSDQGENMKVVYCPTATTSVKYRSGKVSIYSTTIAK